MKKVLIFLFAVCISATMFADDIIITKDSQRINAKIEEVGLDVVKYRRSDNLTGPIYSISKTEIVSVIYENGIVEVFQVQPSTKSSKVEQTNTNNNIPLTDKEYLTYRGGFVWTRDNKGLSKSEYLNLLQNNCPAALNSYRVGVSCNKGGAAMLCIGIPMLAVGIPLYTTGVAEITGSILMSIGSPLVATSIPLFCIGHFKKRKSVDIYNANCAPTLTFDLTAGQNGIGLALNF